jgi:hypothetical protein
VTDFSPTCAVVSLPDIELEGQISCASRRLVAIAPGFTEPVAKAISQKWHQLGPGAVQVVVDPNPEVCRLGLGDMEALALLHATAAELGVTVHQQRGLRVGVIITDETTTIYAPVPRLIEAGGQPGERFNALRLDAPVLNASESGATSVEKLDLHTSPVGSDEIQYTAEDLKTNPPLKFDLARRVRVFNAMFEFVEFELRGLMIDKKTVQIPSDLIRLARDPETQKLLRSSFRLIGDDPAISGDRVVRVKNAIAAKYLRPLPGFGSVILRCNKSDFEADVEKLRHCVELFQRKLKKKLQSAINANKERLIQALLPGVLDSPPSRWTAFIGKHPARQDVERMLREELTRVFGEAGELFRDMKLTVVFKGVTYESLQDPQFIAMAAEKLHLPELHEEFDAAKAAQHETGLTEVR